MRDYFANVGLACTRLLNAVLNGDPDVSFCCRVGEECERGSKKYEKIRRLIDFFISPFEKNHCMKCWRRERYQRFKNR